MLAVGLRAMKKAVAATGEGINDLKALEAADVGFSMGSGVYAAKNVSKMILAQDNIMSIVNAVLWGRNIYSNVRKFIQFQLTVNFSCLFIALLSAGIKGTPVFSVPQLLWINMIMDVLAALALAAEGPQISTITNPPVKNDDPIITKTMMRQILGMTFYVSTVMTLLFFFIDDMWAGDPATLQEHFVNTMLFNCFIQLHLYNQFNCRKIKADQLNPFANILDNFHFLAIWLVINGI